VKSKEGLAESGKGTGRKGDGGTERLGETCQGFPEGMPVAGKPACPHAVAEALA
jgi:hypothetical protein